MLKINKATYGGVDVTSIVQSKIKDGQLRLKVSNDLFGDTAPGVFKYLEIEYDGGYKKAGEKSFISLPESKTNKLGIFYTNNNVEKTVRSSCLNLQRFKNVADILTCVWRPIADNPFYEAYAMTQSSNHLNIIIQMLQLLYAARDMGQYKYVSFLEHDVLYPDGYFDFPDFETGVQTNMNYAGICEKGFQKRMADHEPLHQMTMIFDEAIAHFEKLFKKAVREGSVLLEPDNNRRQWKCLNPALHINHGRHFTSHFSIYSKDTQPEDEYWGEANELIKYIF